MVIADEPLRSKYPEISFSFCLAVARRLVGSANVIDKDPDDLAQDVAIRFCQEADKGAIAFPKAWVERVTLNTVIRATRKRRKCVSLSGFFIPDMAAESSDEPEVPEVLKQLVERILRKATPKERTFISYIFGNGSRSNSEAAKDLQTSPRALTILKNRFREKSQAERTRFIHELVSGNHPLPTSFCVRDIGFGGNDTIYMRAVIIDHLQKLMVSQPHLVTPDHIALLSHLVDVITSKGKREYLATIQFQQRSY
jgi:DNA-directed RNA polymerase specialized sigma24 family protein